MADPRFQTPGGACPNARFAASAGRAGSRCGESALAMADAIAQALAGGDIAATAPEWAVLLCGRLRAPAGGA